MTEPQRRRACILAAADRLLRHYGASKTTVADVAREAGVGVGTVYLEFSSKESIVEELSRDRHRAVLEAMRQAATAPGRPVAEQLAAAFEARVAALLGIAAEGAHACDLVHCVSPAVKSAQATYHADELALIADVIRRGVGAGELEVPDGGDADRTASTLLRAYVSFTLPWLRDRDPAELRAALAAMHGLVLRGLERRSARPRRR
jgi:AcrR family transcriptional regulator